jgi:hypothetical protein
MRMRCSPSATGDPITLAELVARASRALAWVAPPDRFVVPACFEDYLTLLDGASWYGHHVTYGFRLSSPAAIAAGAEGDTPEDHEDHELAREAGLWIGIGGWSDRHAYYLCCDRERSACGRVVDAHDNHPYLAPQHLSDLGSFEEWLASVQEIRDRSAGHLIALTAEERILLDPLHDDPWRLVVAARDLEYRLCPIDGTSRPTAEPDRILYISRPPAISPLVSNEEARVAFIPPAELATFQPEAHRIGGYVPSLRLEDIRARLAAFAGAPGGILFVGNP